MKILETRSLLARITAKITNHVFEINDMVIPKLVLNKLIKVILDWDEWRANQKSKPKLVCKLVKKKRSRKRQRS